MKLSQFENFPFGENTYILWNEESKRAAIIDPGMMHDQERRAIKEFIDEHQLVIEHLLLTHCHVDHAASAQWVAQEYHVDVKACKDEASLAKSLAVQAQRFHLDIDVEPLAINHPIADGDVIKLDDVEIHVLGTPGHTPGGLTFYVPGISLAFTGDSIFQGSIGRTDLPGGDYTQLINTIEQKIITLPDKTVLASGHGPKTTVRHEKEYNPYIH